jgi:hypothetical protein
VNRRAVVGVMPAQELERRRRLFAALARAFPVDFAPCPPDGSDGLDGVVAFDRPGAVGPALTHGLAAFHAPLDGHARAQSRGTIAFASASASAPDVDPRLRGTELADTLAGDLPGLAPSDAEQVVARGPCGPVWVRSRSGPPSHRVALSPAELGSTSRLKDELQDGRWLALLPLVQFLRELTGYTAWTHPPRRAALMLDDVNLHWPSYGYVDLGRLTDHADAHGYHLSLAMVPLDAAFVSRRAVAIVRSSPHVSLLMHGNDHLKCELARDVHPDRALESAAQAVRRVERFERRTGIPVDRVVAPPHGACSSVHLAALARAGVEAVSYRLGPIDVDDALIGWHPGDLPAGSGVTGLQRLPFAASRGEVLLRSYLDQPIILYGHHTDLRQIDALAAAAATVSSLGPVRWMAPVEIGRSNYATTEVGSSLLIRPFTRRLRLSLPAGIDHVIVEPPGGAGSDPVRVRLVGGSGDVVDGSTGVSLRVAGRGPGPEQLEVRLPVEGEVDPHRVPAPPRRAWPVLRRCLTEGRDRAVPILERLAGTDRGQRVDRRG